jgi:hypothetical protein
VTEKLETDLRQTQRNGNVIKEWIGVTQKWEQKLIRLYLLGERNDSLGGRNIWVIIWCVGWRIKQQLAPTMNCLSDWFWNVDEFNNIVWWNLLQRVFIILLDRNQRRAYFFQVHGNNWIENFVIIEWSIERSFLGFEFERSWEEDTFHSILSWKKLFFARNWFPSLFLVEKWFEWE